MGRTFSPDEARRYARHIVLKGVGGPGQQKLKAARVLVIGAGGLGSPVIAYLAAAGAGTIGVADDDRIALSNLQRQIIHTTNDVGRSKTGSAVRFAGALNPEIKVVAHDVRLGRDNASSLIAQYDLVADGSDNFATRQTVANSCQARARPLVSGAVSMFDGQVTVFKPYASRPDGKKYPSFDTLYPTAPRDGDLPGCEASGIIGAVTGVIGSLMAMEVIKLITGVGEPLAGRLMLYDGRGARFSEFSYGADVN